MVEWGGGLADIGEVKKKPTVGRRTDLPWVGETTYSSFFRRPTVGRFLALSRTLLLLGRKVPFF